MMRFFPALRARVAGGLDFRSAAALAALGAIWYGVESARPAFWIVGALVYVPLLGFALLALTRSRRSG